MFIVHTYVYATFVSSDKVYENDERVLYQQKVIVLKGRSKFDKLKGATYVVDPLLMFRGIIGHYK
jgi:hypothetical protein